MGDRFQWNGIVEYPLVVWLSSLAYRETAHVQTLIEQIRDIVYRMEITTNIDECDRTIRARRDFSEQSQFFLIVTNDCISAVVDRCLHQMRAVRAIFILGERNHPQDFYEEENLKLKAKCLQDTDLLVEFYNSVQLFSTTSGMLLSTLVSGDAPTTTNIINNFADYAEFSFPLFLDLLVDLPLLTETEHRQQLLHFATQCRRFYVQNSSKLAEIDLFVSPTTGYTRATAIRWYTADRFLYKQVNKALCQQNITAIFDFRFFLADMRAQLAALDPVPDRCDIVDGKIKVYRGQRIFSHELDALRERRRAGSLLSVNSYFSTSFRRDVAMTFTGSLGAEVKAVIFEIEAEYRAPDPLRRKPFAYIGELSQIGPVEREVLFSVGSMFRLTHDIEFNAEANLYIVRMSFVYEEDQSPITSDFMALRQCSSEEKLIKTGDLLFNRDEHNGIKAKAFYQQFLDGNYPLSWQAASHAGLGWLAFKIDQLDEAIVCQNTALKMYSTLPDNDCRKYLFATSYNCLAAVDKKRRQYASALTYYQQAHDCGRVVPSITKYDFYNLFSNIPLVNMAIIENLLGSPQRAWSTYQRMIAVQMRENVLLRSPAYLHIVEASFFLPDDDHTLANRMQACEEFLTLSYDDMSASYRASIVAGTFQIIAKMTANPHTHDRAMIYLEKIIDVCQRFESLSASDCAVVLQSRLDLAKLYKQKRLFAKAIEQAVSGLGSCRAQGVQGRMDCYQLLKEIYQQQLGEAPARAFQDTYQFQWSEFSFGQNRKTHDSAALQNGDLQRYLTYCYLKLAGLTYEVDEYPFARTIAFLNQALTMSSNNPTVQTICRNNTLYAQYDFERLIAFYQLDADDRYLQSDAQRQLCIDEEAYSYLGHLYERRANNQQAAHWYMKAIDRFKDRRYVCVHTQSCFVHAADFYTRTEGSHSPASIYRQLIEHLLDFHHPSSPLQRSIVNITESVFVPLMTTADKPIRDVYQHIAQLALKQPDDIIGMDDDFRRVVSVCREATGYQMTLADGYRQYLNVLLSPDQRFLTDQTGAIRGTFERAIDVHGHVADGLGVIKIYQLFINVILRHAHSCERLIDAVKTLGFELERSHQIDEALVVYDALERFLQRFPSQDCPFNDGVINFLLDRYRILSEEHADRAIVLHKKIIDSLRTFRTQVNRHYDLNTYLDGMERFHMRLAVIEPEAAPETYSSLLDFFRVHRPERLNQQLDRIAAALQHRPRDLLVVLTHFRIDCTALLRQVRERSLLPNDQPGMFEPLTACGWTFVDVTASSFLRRAQRLAVTGRSAEAIEQCFGDCIRFLLETQSINDERLANCYTQLGDPQSAADAFAH